MQPTWGASLLQWTSGCVLVNEEPRERELPGLSLISLGRNGLWGWWRPLGIQKPGRRRHPKSPSSGFRCRGQNNRPNLRLPSDRWERGRSCRLPAYGGPTSGHAKARFPGAENQGMHMNTQGLDSVTMGRAPTPSIQADGSVPLWLSQDGFLEEVAGIGGAAA